PLAVQVASRHGLDLTSAVPHSLSTAPKSEGLLVTVCDQANEELTGLPMERLHWSIPDPVGTGTLKAFEQAYRQLHQQVEILATYTQMAGTPSGSQP
ncbi:MAG: ArsR family transcriptional regulator, partial [Dehalococcoidia bacterium]